MKLRIFLVAPAVLLTDHRSHGDGLVAFGFIRELAARGHDLHVAAQHVELSWSPPSNVQLHCLGAGNGPVPLARLEFMRRVRRLYRRLERTTTFDVVHQLNPVEVGVSLALAGVPAPVVLGPYVPDWPQSRTGADAVVSRLKRAVRAGQQRRATTLLLSTPAAAAKIAFRSPHVRELSPGIDDRLWVPGNGRRGQDVLVLANLERRKGVAVAVEAFARISDELPEARLLIAGTGPETEALRRRVRAMACPSRVSFLGHVGRDLVPATMQACDVYCMPSFGEPFGMTALEAMACAKPIVATDAGGVRHIVSERGGRRVPPGNPEALGAALRELLLDPALRRSMGEHNRRVIEERYGWAPVVDRLEGLYREAIREPRAAGAVPRLRRYS